MFIGQGIGAGGGGGGGDRSEENAGSAPLYGARILFLTIQSIFDNIALAPSSDPSTVPFHRVVEACRAANL